MKKNKKLLKILGGVIGIGAIACVIPACVVSCGSSGSTVSQPASQTTTTSSNDVNTKSTSSNRTTTSSTKTDGTTTKAPTQSSHKPTKSDTASYPKTNPYYMLGNTSNTSTLVSEPITTSPLEFYLGGSTTPNTSVQLSNNTYNINLQLNPMGQSDEGSVLTSYSTTPTLLAIVPNSTLTTNFGGKTVYTFNKSSPLLLQAVSGDPFQTNNMTDNTTLNNVSLPMYVTNKESGKALTSIQLPIPYEAGTLDFGLTSETFPVDVNSTAYTINLEVNFTPYLVQATTPLTAKDFNLTQSIPPSSSGLSTYGTYEDYYGSENSRTLEGDVDDVPAPAPTLPDGYNVWLNWDGNLSTNTTYYLNEFNEIVEYNLTQAEVNQIVQDFLQSAQ